MQNRDYRLNRLKPNFRYKSYKFKWFCKNSQIGKILYSADSFMRAWLCTVLSLMQSGVMSPNLWTSQAVQVNTFYKNYKNCCAKYWLFTIFPFNMWSGLRYAPSSNPQPLRLNESPLYMNKTCPVLFESHARKLSNRIKSKKGITVWG